MTPPVLSAINHSPRELENHLFEMIYALNCPPSDVWNWINSKRSFTDVRPPMSMVEFNSADFKQGTIHLQKGLFFQLSGYIGKIKTSSSREIHYFYGSHILAMKWIRPVQMKCWVEETPNGCTLKVHFESQVSQGIKGIWNFMQKMYWKYYGRCMRRALKSSLN